MNIILALIPEKSANSMINIFDIVNFRVVFTLHYFILADLRMISGEDEDREPGWEAAEEEERDSDDTDEDMVS